VALLAHRQGMAWLPEKLLEYSRRFNVPLTYDAKSAGADITREQLDQQVPRPRMNPHHWADVSNAATLFMKEMEEGNLRHFNQPDLNRATQAAIKRGPLNSSRWTFGMKEATEDISPLDACAQALWAFDQMKEQATGIIFAA
jgi:hypothetical protein